MTSYSRMEEEAEAESDAIYAALNDLGLSDAHLEIAFQNIRRLTLAAYQDGFSAGKASAMDHLSA